MNQHKIPLDESHTPTQWYNLVSEPAGTAPRRRCPPDLQPVGPDDLDRGE